MIEAVAVGHGDGRRHWPDAVKEGLVARALEPGANVSAIARQAGIVPSQLFGWRRAALSKGMASPHLSAVGIGVSAAAHPAHGVVEIVLDSAVVRVGADIGEAHLRRVIRAVRSA